jgi:hypothetical protein
MKATILSHSQVPDEAHAEIHRFRFVLEHSFDSPPYTDSISLRTARALVWRLDHDNPLMRMLRAIVEATAADYDSLVGRKFGDNFVYASVISPIQGVQHISVKGH